MTLDLTRFGQWRKYGILKSFVNSFSFIWPFNYLCTAICPSKGVRNSRHLILRPYFWCYFVFYSSRCHQRQIDLHHFDLKVAKIVGLLFVSKKWQKEGKSTWSFLANHEYDVLKQQKMLCLCRHLFHIVNTTTNVNSETKYQFFSRFCFVCLQWQKEKGNLIGQKLFFVSIKSVFFSSLKKQKNIDKNCCFKILQTFWEHNLKSWIFWANQIFLTSFFNANKNDLEFVVTFMIHNSTHFSIFFFYHSANKNAQISISIK